MYNSSMMARKRDWTTQDVGPTSPKIKEMEAKFSELRKNWKNATAKCREDIRKDLNTKQTTTRGATSRLNLWKMQQSPSRLEKRDRAEQIMAGALLTSIAKMRSAARQTTVESLCSASPRSPKALSVRMASPKTRSFRRSRFWRSTSLPRERVKLDDHSPEKPRLLSVLPVASSSSDSLRRSTEEEKSSTEVSSSWKQSSTQSSPQPSSLRLPSSPYEKRKGPPGKITMEIPLSEMIEGSTSSIMSSPRFSNMDTGEAGSEQRWRESSRGLRSKMRAWPAVDLDFIDVDLNIDEIPDIPR